MSDVGWPDLDAALGRWAAAGRSARLWLRDDDAVDLTPELETLLALTEAFGTPLLMAVIPAAARPALVDRLDAFDRVLVAQHGFAHVNHAPAGEKASEYPADRPLADVEAELRRGGAMLEKMFARQFRPVLVPPWNRIGDVAAAALPTLGYAALSTFGNQHEAPPPGLPVFNTHADLIDWKGGRVFRGETRVLRALVEALDHALPTGAPVGVLLHHRDHDEASWTFLEELLARTPTCWVGYDALARAA